MGKPRPTGAGYDRVLNVAMQPWALTPPMLAIVASVLGRRLAGETLDTSQLVQRPPAQEQTTGGVALIPIHGVIAPRMNLFSDISGGATFEGASAALAEALAHPDVSTIVLDFDSPGGSVLGATEFAREVLAARTRKRVIAQANYEMCSAAFWVGACATEIVAAPSAMVGSVGVYSIHEDLSKALEEAGIKLTYISAGKFKVEGNEAEPLSASARDRIQALVDTFYARFVGDVAKGRGRTDADISAGYGQGRAVTADEALSLGMVDRIATLDETLARVLPSGSKPLALAQAVAPPLPLDTPHEPPKATGHDRAGFHRAAERALLALGF